MADIDNKVLSDLASSIRGMNKMDMFPRTNEDRSFEAFGKKLEDIEKGQRTDTKKMVESYDAAMKKHGISKDIKDFKSILEAKDQHKAMKEILSAITDVDKETQKLTFDTFREADRMLEGLQKNAASAGTTLEEMGISVVRHFDPALNKQVVTIKDHDKTVNKLTKDTDRFGDAIEEAAEETEAYTTKVNIVKNALGKMGNIAKTVGKDFIRLAEQEQRFAQQNATADAGWIDGVTRMQISTLDYMKILKATRRESLAMGAAGIDFKDALEQGADGLRGLTYDSTEAAKMSKEFAKNTARFGVGQGALGDAIGEQTSLYEKHYRVMGYSVEEFSNLTQELINDQGMRSTLLTLQEKERKAYIMGVQQRQVEYQTMGFTIERAKELQKTFQALNKMNPKERMKKAAKQRAMMGAMGMGAEGEELFNLQTRYRTMNVDEKAKADIRMTEIQSQAAGKFGSMSGAGSSLGQSMSMQMMAEKTGFLEVAEKFETASGEGLKISKEQLAAAQEAATTNNEIDDKTKLLLHGQDAWRAAENTALTSIATNLLSGFAELALINTAGFATGALASAGAGKYAATAYKNAGKVGKIMGRAFGPLAAAGIGVAIGNAITDFWKGSDPLGYADAADTFGTAVDWVGANIFRSEELQKKLEQSAKAEAMMADDKQKRDEAAKLLAVQEKQLEGIENLYNAQRESGVIIAEATDKQTGAQKDANRRQAIPGSRSSGG